MKMAYQYWKKKYWRKIGKDFICFEGAYHGGHTLGAMSAGERSIFTEVFKLKTGCLDCRGLIPYPETWKEMKQ